MFSLKEKLDALVLPANIRKATRLKLDRNKEVGLSKDSSNYSEDPTNIVNKVGAGSSVASSVRNSVRNTPSKPIKKYSIGAGAQSLDVSQDYIAMVTKDPYAKWLLIEYASLIILE